MKASRLKGNIAYSLALQLINMIFQIITVPYVSRVVGANGIGIYSFSYTVATYFVIFIILGLNNYGNRMVAETKDDTLLLSRVFFEIYIFQFFLGMIVFAIYGLYAFQFANDKKAAVLLGGYVFSAIFDINWAIYGLEQFDVIFKRNVLVKTTCAICLFAFVNKESDVYVYCAIMAGTTVVSQLLLWPSILKNIEVVKPTIYGIIRHIKPNMLLFVTVLAVSLFKIMDKTMLGFMASYREVGYYESAEKVINIPILFCTALGTVMLPRVTNMISKKKGDDIMLLEATIVLVMLITVPLSAGLMAVSDVFVPIFYGDGYEKCILLYKILLPSCLFLGFANVIRTQFLIPHKMDKAYVVSACLGAIVNISINLLLIPKFGSLGAAVGTLMAEFFVCCYQCYKVRKSVPIVRCMLLASPTVLSGIIMYFVVCRINIISFAWGQLVLKTVIGLLSYFIFLLLLILWKKDYYVALIKTLIEM